MDRFIGSTENAHNEHALAKQHEVTSLPSSPKPDEVYVMDVSDDLTPAYGGFMPDQLEFKLKLWIGAAGFKIVAPNGNTLEILPEYTTWTRGRTVIFLELLQKLGNKPATKYMRMYALTPWLKKETDFYKQVSDALGMEEHEKAAPRTKENTGSCACCFRNIKLRASGASLRTIVNHGFKRPGWGEIVGNCIGVGFPPFELSPEGTKHLVKVLGEQRTEAETKLKKVNSETITVLEGRGRGQLVKPGDPDWALAVSTAKTNLSRRIKWLTDDIEGLEKLIGKWQEQPLPKAGTTVTDWQFKKR
jgi:hypothetical protein